VKAIRLNKYLADCGVCARRKADDLIRSGHVTVDGRRAEVGESVDPLRHVVAVRGKRVTAPVADHVTIVLNKPLGVVTTMSDDRGRPTVARFLPTKRRLFPIGRLDVETTGVLLFTSDGDLAEALAHPSHGVAKRYRVRARGQLTDESRAALGASDVRAQRDGTVTFDVVLHEGKNRQVRRMCAQLGLRVLDLQRVSFGPVTLRGLDVGKMRALTAGENAALVKIRESARRSVGRSTVKVDRSKG
jgi:23S rRNA pseudouridine2605 synthase